MGSFGRLPRCVLSHFHFPGNIPVNGTSLLGLGSPGNVPNRTAHRCTNPMLHLHSTRSSFRVPTGSGNPPPARLELAQTALRDIVSAARCQSMPMASAPQAAPAQRAPGAAPSRRCARPWDYRSVALSEHAAHWHSQIEARGNVSCSSAVRRCISGKSPIAACSNGPAATKRILRTLTRGRKRSAPQVLHRRLAASLPVQRQAHSSERGSAAWLCDRRATEVYRFDGKPWRNGRRSARIQSGVRSQESKESIRSSCILTPERPCL